MTYKYIFVGKPEGNRPLIRISSRWENNIKMYIKQVVRIWIGFIWLKYCPKAGSCENQVSK
jgi:CRISPR/Cas system-associated protein Cas5 (RAMP superfamily)